MKANKNLELIPTEFVKNEEEVFYPEPLSEETLEDLEFNQQEIVIQ
jgi:hypothetical protein